VFCATVAGFAVACEPAGAASPTADERALDAFANRFAVVCTPGNFACMNHYAVVGAYAAARYSDGKHRAGMFVAKKDDGTWTIVSRGGGTLREDDLLLIAPAMADATAKRLVAKAIPIWTCC
jgi:hypothetical protein